MEPLVETVEMRAAIKGTVPMTLKDSDVMEDIVNAIKRASFLRHEENERAIEITITVKDVDS